MSDFSYTVELERWGIKDNETDAANTTLGINQAFLWARENDYNLVVLPKGRYLIDKNASVNLNSNTTYKLYDCVFVKESNNFTGYTVLSCNNVKNVTIEGATVIGDRETHDYSSGGTHEWGHGIECKNSCYNIVLNNCEVSECTGDGFTTAMDFSAIGGIQHPAHFAKGDINAQGNIDVSKSNYTTVSRFFDVTGSTVKSVGYFYYSGDGYGGYGTGSNLNKTVIKVHFYKSDGSYLGFRNTRTYELIYLSSLPEGTAKVRFSYLQNFDLMNGNLHYVLCARIPQYITYINCKAHRNRRLGASVNGGRFITYDRCELYNNSNPMSNSQGCNPGYGIDIEDGYMTNQKITVKNCNFYDNRAGAFICISTRGVYLENNKFKGAVNLSGSGDDYLSHNNIYYGPITGRSITSGNEADGTFVTFRNDSIFDASCSINAGNTTLENCVFTKSSLNLFGETLKIYNCKLTFDDPDKDAGLRFASKNIEIYDSLFDVRRAGGLVTASYNQTESALFKNVKFLTNETSGGHYVGAKNLIVEDCEFIHSGNKVNYSRMMASRSMRVQNSTFRNQSFRFDGGDIYGSEILAEETGYVTHKFSNNTIIWDASYGTAVHEARGPGVAFLYIPRLEVTDNNLRVVGKNVSLGAMHSLRVYAENYLVLSNNTIVTKNDIGISTKGTITIESAYRKSGSSLPKPRTIIVAQNNNSINSEIVFTKNLDLQLEKNIVGNIPLPAAADSEPSTGTYMVGQIIYNVTPVAGGYVGWICVASGIANKNPWSPNKSYTINSLVNANGKVYRCIAAGSSGASAPSNTNGTAQDGSITWEYVGALAVFKPFGLISS
ncbi:right-handed parallel beta-helix repeat-containing protein [Metabacillus sp. 84]|uniref:right-handed parallel beta-helix repeat-containing protein n=1 Tax=Metabacillus sp. 84 TaxID=3404705 RepID=UPI003CF0BB2B